MKLSIILPCIRPQNVVNLVESIKKSCSYEWELIVVGPNKPDIECKFVYSLAAPTKCVQLGMLLATGKYFTWSSDDGLYLPNALDECIELLDNKSNKDGVIVRYAEGKNLSGQCPNDNYWIGYTHDDQRLPGVNPNWKIAPVGMYHTQTFMLMGGFDCKFEHINMSTHDFAYRIQKNEGELFLSPNLTFTCDWSQGTLNESEHVPVHNAYFENDKPYFTQLYSIPNEIITIDYNNWKNTPDTWRRFN